jgi:pimeloyl-ACP methyl ester carboxylesterase
MAKEENYEDYRAVLIDEYYANQLETLVSGFNPERKTVILLPGGMGSQLQRTEHPFPEKPNPPDDVIWLDAGIFGLPADGLKLEIDKARKDIDAYVVAARGPIGFWTQMPYEELENRARDHWNYGVFGFDWRRPLKESAAYFKSFIGEFRKRVRAKFHRDPIPNLTIVCHSMGGLVAAAALRDEDFSGLAFNAVVTIATPFYGTSTQQDRYFIGEKSLNWRYGAETVARIIASLLGPYTLMFLPQEVFLSDGGSIGLTAYPEHDPSNKPCDPFSAAMKPRWPQVVQDHWQCIEDAKQEMIEIAKPINSKIVPRFFNVRSALDKKTAVELIWDGDSVDPENGSTSPLSGRAGPGDGTVPAWSAFHAYCKDQNRHDLTQTQGTEHANLLNHDEVLTLIETVVATGKLSAARRKLRKRPKADAKGPAVLTPKKLDAAVTKWVADSRDKLVPLPPPPEVQRAFVASLIGGTKPRMVGKSRIMLDQRTKRARERKARPAGNE